MTPRHPRVTVSFHDWRIPVRPVPSSWAERLLQALGADPSFTDALLGDLAEERARRAEERGAVVARWWYAREAVRSVPHLLWNALSHGGARGRVRVAAMVAVVAFVPAVVVQVALLLHRESPVRLVIDGQAGGSVYDGIVLNTRHPVQLAMRVLDAKGRPLRSMNVQYQWIEGIPMRVTPSGVVTCGRAGDASVRVSAGAVDTTVQVRCRPVNHVLAKALSFIAGDSAQALAFGAFAPDGGRVGMLVGELRVQDSSVAALQGLRIRPLAPGSTQLIIRIGDGEAWVPVDVYEPVRTLKGLRPDQRLVIAPVRLAPGDTIRWPLPIGLLDLAYGPASDPQPRPVLAVDGPVRCTPALRPTVDRTYCLVRGPGASVRIMYPPAATKEIVGNLALQRRPNR